MLAISGGAPKDDSHRRKTEAGFRSKGAAVGQTMNAADAGKAGPKARPKGGSLVDADVAAEDDTRKKLFKDLMDAIKEGSSAKLEAVIKSNPGCLNEKFGRAQETPLLLILRNGNESTKPLIEKLLSFGPDVNERDGRCRTPLMLASARGLKDIVATLLEHNALIEAQDLNKETALYNAVMRRKESVVTVLLHYEANPNTANKVLRTPLHIAAWHGFHEMVDLLLLVDNIDVDPKEVRGHTPLYDACSRGHVTVARTLLENGADVNAKTVKGWTPLHIAAKLANADMVKDLLQFGADTMLYTQTLNTPETLVPKNDSKGIIELLKRTDLEGNGTMHRTGKDLKVGKPNPEQEDVCRYFKGFIWPSVDKTYRYDTLTVWDMLYSDNPKVKKLGAGGGKPVWIHLPANVMEWVEDIFKLIFSAEKDTSKGKSIATGENGSTNEGSDATLRNIMQFFESNFREVGRQEYTCFRQPHYKCAFGPRPRLRASDNYMTSAVIPIIDVDMQQPYYYVQDEDEEQTDEEDESEDAYDFDGDMSPARKRRLVAKYRTSEGRKLSTEEQAHVDYMRNLKWSYNNQTHLSRTLDESFYELLEGFSVNHRNGDQVLSRYLGRFRLNVEGDEDEDSGMSEASGDEKLPDNEIEQVSNAGNDGAAPLDGNGINRKEGDGQAAVDGDRPAPSLAGTGQAPTPSQLENQATEKVHRQSREWLMRMVSKVKNHTKVIEDIYESEIGEEESGDNGKLSDLEDGSDEEDDDGEDDDDEKDTKQKRPRQQIVVVPQLWIWKVQNVIVTAFPDRWDSSNPRVLPKIMLASVEEWNKAAKKEQMLADMDVQGVLYEMINSCLSFEPWFSTYDEDRSYNDAFGEEIAYVSNETTACYGKYRKSLGKAEEGFAAAMKAETELLMMIDDILSEISMIKRVQEDQALVCTAMKEEEDGIAHHIKGYFNMSPRKPPKSSSPGVNRRAMDDLQLDLFPLQDRRKGRQLPNARPNTKLERHEQDAKRVRESIITLLDLRQRQASTENAINSGKQSQILFEQSKVLFIFTGATVIFAPLSWVSSLLALNIDNFTTKIWRIDQVFGASFGSLMGTLLLCFVFWKVYGYYFSEDDISNADNQNWLQRFFWRVLIKRSSRKTRTNGSQSLGDIYYTMASSKTQLESNRTVRKATRAESGGKES